MQSKEVKLTESQAILYTQHKEWLNHPLTKALLAGLRKHQDSIAEGIAGSAMDKDKPDDHIRRLATQLATTKHIHNLIYDSTTFASKCCSD